jgi:hypothetical protein
MQLLASSLLSVPAADVGISKSVSLPLKISAGLGANGLAPALSTSISTRTPNNNVNSSQ